MTTTTLIIARHGNTFAPDETPRRVGARTDLPLVQSGQEQARRLGRYLHDHNLTPARIFTSHLLRTKQTAELAVIELGQTIPVKALDIFNEIDYGFDENKPEDQVIARIGDESLKLWETDGVMPEGWSPHPRDIRLNWLDFAATTLRQHEGEKTLVVTSNGIARFALHLTGDWITARSEHGLKLSTGALGILTRKKDTSAWTVAGWNIRP
jgi:2,3-bisphosphoglycerate-dependent phosphoglycerate mutase